MCPCHRKQTFRGAAGLPGRAAVIVMDQFHTYSGLARLQGNSTGFIDVVDPSLQACQSLFALHLKLAGK